MMEVEEMNTASTASSSPRPSSPIADSTFIRSRAQRSQAALSRPTVPDPFCATTSCRIKEWARVEYIGIKLDGLEGLERDVD
ncbi:hypothetical protein PV325_007384 [Microctonus aethiopoides]|nr:hypothetical protein PV325_007384 [Microctonus aethiopoides]